MIKFTIEFTYFAEGEFWLSSWCMVPIFWASPGRPFMHLSRSLPGYAVGDMTIVSMLMTFSIQSIYYIEHHQYEICPA